MLMLIFIFVDVYLFYESVVVEKRNNTATLASSATHCYQQQ